MPSWQDIVNFFTREGRVVREAPASFALALVIAALLIWGALSWRYSSQLENKDSVIQERDSALATKDATIKEQDSFLTEYRSRLNVSSPREAEDQLNRLQQSLSVAQADIRKLSEHEGSLPTIRSIKPDELRLFMASAKAFSGSPPVVLTEYNMGCIDCDAFSQDINNMINQVPSWIAHRNGSFMGIGYESPGITLFIGNPSQPSPGAMALMDALKAAGLKFNVMPGAPYSPERWATAEIAVNPSRP